ncbi:MAG: hypothetical protein KTR33_17345 [Gammaproteobacteria bacterium]|nr:hypothetical protein [Gammaproteobacteria bacterium]
MLIKAREAECGTGMATAEQRYMELAHRDCAAKAMREPNQSLPGKVGTTVIRSQLAHSSSQLGGAVFAQSAAR